jgi:hypothetical protein
MGKIELLYILYIRITLTRPVIFQPFLLFALLKKMTTEIQFMNKLIVVHKNTPNNTIDKIKLPKTSNIIQLHMNRLHLPYDVVDVIKSFLFYDIKTYIIILNSKIQKQIIHILLMNDAISRANHFNNQPSYTDNEEDWAFGFSGLHPTEDLQLQAINCGRCGNYMTHTNMYAFPYSNHIYCTCHLIDDGWNTDDLYSDDEDE